MREISIKLYKFDELSDKAKRNVLDRLEYMNVEGDGWDDQSLEEFRERLEKAGFNDAKIRYSGFCSQGDGLCFDAKVDLWKLVLHLKAGKKYAKLRKAIQDKRVMAEIVQVVLGYSHERTRRLEITDDCGKDLDQGLIGELENELESLRISLCQEFYGELEDEYLYLLDDERVADAVRANEMEFTESGYGPAL